MQLYQQGTQRIEVIVRKETGASTIGVKEKATDEASGDNQNTQSTNSVGNNDISRKIANRNDRIFKTNLTHTLALTKQLADSAIQFYVSWVGAERGDQAYQQNVQRNWEILQDVSNVASSVSRGAMFGAWGGAVGVLFGSLIGLASTGTSVALKYANREQEFKYKVFKENNSIEYQRARASINLTTGRLR